DNLDGGFFENWIDEVEIFSRALNAPEVLGIFNAGGAGKCSCVPAPPAMAGWWTLDETSGTTSADIIGPNDGTWMGTPTPVLGEVAGALQFNGTTDFVEVPSSTSLNFGPATGGVLGDLSIDAWINV